MTSSSVFDLLPPFKNGKTTTWEQFEANVSAELSKSIPELECAQETVSREKIIRLAVAFNQAKVTLCSRTVPHDLLERAERLCEHFHVKRLAMAGRWSLERRLGEALKVQAEAHCCRCGRALSNRVSVEVRMGPVCRGHREVVRLG